MKITSTPPGIQKYIGVDLLSQRNPSCPTKVPGDEKVKLGGAVDVQISDAGRALKNASHPLKSMFGDE
jgi:hypothetical protein